MNEPSKKQIEFAKRVSLELRIKLPEEKTKYAYWKFINEHMDAYNESKCSRIQGGLDMIGMTECEFLGY